MSNSLAQYPHIEFRRDAVDTRIKLTKSILANLSLLAEHPDGEHRLYLDNSKNEYWQYASAWNWGAKPYCFIVPAIEAGAWIERPYVDPDELLLYVAAMRQFLSVPSNRAIPNLKKHIQMLQRTRSMPQDPTGRWFDPYKPENIIPKVEQGAAANP